jgi:hypothetical protein
LYRTPRNRPETHQVITVNQVVELMVKGQGPATDWRRVLGEVLPTRKKVGGEGGGGGGGGGGEGAAVEDEGEEQAEALDGDDDGGSGGGDAAAAEPDSKRQKVDVDVVTA